MENSEEETDEISLLEIVTEQLKEYNDTVKSSVTSIKEGKTILTDVLTKVSSNFQTIIGSERHKFSIVGAEYAKSTASLIQQSNNLNKDLIKISREKIDTNIRLQQMLKELKIEEKKTENGEEGASSFDPTKFLGNMDRHFTDITKQESQEG